LLLGNLLSMFFHNLKGKKKNIYIPSSQTKGTIKTQKTKDKTITGNKETQMTGQHEPL